MSDQVGNQNVGFLMTRLNCLFDFLLYVPKQPSEVMLGRYSNVFLVVPKYLNFYSTAVRVQQLKRMTCLNESSIIKNILMLICGPSPKCNFV